MRTFILAGAIAATILPAAAMAQSYGEVRHDQREINQDRRDLRRDRADGDRRELRDDRRDLRADRQERREDWRDYRRSHPAAFHGPAYVGPRGWRYRPVTIGYRFAPEYYGERYWIRDPYAYRLPAPGALERWVRYGNDVVLVNVRTGRVIAVNGGFFY